MPRLHRGLGAQGAGARQGELVRGTGARAARGGLAPVELWVSGAAHEAFFAGLGAEYRCALRQQRGVDLGARMSHALGDSLRTARFAVLIGSDCPAMDAHYLEHACESLVHGADAVLGPAEDGGYVLIGARRGEPALFTDIAWGTSDVLAQTRVRLAELGWHWDELPVQWDLDRPEDLARLARLQGGPH